MKISLIVPAYNEELYIGATLERVKLAALFAAGEVTELDIIVVDNASTDATAEIAAGFGARIIPETVHNIARVRNAGAAAADGEILIFIDADTLVPETFFVRVLESMQDLCCLGGAVDTLHQAHRKWVQLYLGLWRCLANLTHMAQGAAQYCRAESFRTLGGYDDTLYMGEDVDFFWRLRQLARRTGSEVRMLTDIRVIPSARRFDQWTAYQILVWTNPMLAMLFRRKKSVWWGWYDRIVR